MEETPVDTSVLDYQQPNSPSPERGEKRLEDIWGMLPLVTTTPTWIPKTFREGLALDTSTNKIYYYDFENQQWRTSGAEKVVGNFGGDGSDGALTITSGNTGLNLGSAAVVVKNYTTLSITGTGILTPTSPHTNGTKLILKVQGDVTITSSATRAIDMRGLGGQGGAGGSSSGANGSNGNKGSGVINGSPQGLLGVGGATGTGGAASEIFTASTAGIYKRQNDQSRAIFLACGSGGGGGGAGQAASGGGAGGTGGAGGHGGGALIIECGGALNFTGTIDMRGTAGTTGNSGSNSSGAGGGGGGGSGGMCVVLYNTLTANSGTINDGGEQGGAGGTGGNGNSASANGEGGGGGSGGGSIGGAGGAGGNKTVNGSAAGGTSAGGGGGGGGNGVIHPTNPGGAGGTGGAGGGSHSDLLVIANTEFA